jgi:hypothetical protein
MEVTSTITCPVCQTETMELNACRYLSICPSCGAALRPYPGECCGFWVRHEVAPME